MTWVKLDDTCPDHPAIIGLSDAAFACWIRSLCYSSRHLTDGFIPANVRRTLGTSKAATELVNAGRWEPVDGGWRIHDYTQRQRTRQQVELERDRWRDRQQRHRGVTPESRRDSGVCHSGVTPPEESRDRVETESGTSVKQNITSRVPAPPLNGQGEPIPLADLLGRLDRS